MSATDIQAHADYMHDQLLQERLTVEHAELLRAQAAARILQAKEARQMHGLSPNPSSRDDTIKHYHAVSRMLHEQAYYPPHDKRTESSKYARVHHLMTVVDDAPCLVCEVRHSELGDATKNLFGAVQMETHHHLIEWALANAIDAAKFNTRVRPGLQRRAMGRQPTHPEYAEFDQLYGSRMTVNQIRDWIDHGYDNLWVLCDVHHRHKFVGIHAITYPIWGPQDIVNAELVDKELSLAKNTKQQMA